MAAANEREKAQNPEDIPRLFMAFARAGDSEGIATLFEDDAVLALPPGKTTIGSEAIAAAFAKRFSGQSFDSANFQQLPVLRCGDLALTSTRVSGGRTTVEVARQQADGSWRWVIDQPDVQG